MDISKRLKELRESRGLTQGALADKLSITRSTIGMIESGSRNPSLEVIEELADFFNVSVNYLMGKEDYTARYVDPKMADLIDDELFKRMLAAGGKLPRENLEAFVQAMEMAAKACERK